MSLRWENAHQPDTDRVLRVMTPDDLSQAVQLSQNVGWGHGLPDWERLLYWSPEGCFVLDEPGRGLVGTVTTTAYGTTLAWIGMMIIAPDRQRQGLGRQLMRATLDHLRDCGIERIMLDASEAGRGLYEKLGFRAVQKVERWEGRTSTYLGPRAQPLRTHDINAMLTLDARLFGVKRPQILFRLLDEFPALAWVDYHQGRLEGYLLAHPLGDRISLGPWMSWSASSAERLLRVAMEQLQGADLVMNIPDNNGRALMVARNHSFHRVRYCTRMIYGSTAQPISGELLAELAVASLATG
ncbi:MAG: GNAT family N-acetyltransferase [Chloroflexi bacterium]|nr:GNAT family N-acetyltransferase [Chloroflexota bacterium]